MKYILLIILAWAFFYQYSQQGDYYGTFIGGLKFRYDESVRSHTLKEAKHFSLPPVVEPDAQTQSNIENDPVFYMKLAKLEAENEKKYKAIETWAAKKHGWRN